MVVLAASQGRFATIAVHFFKIGNATKLISIMDLLQAIVDWHLAECAHDNKTLSAKCFAQAFVSMGARVVQLRAESFLKASELHACAARHVFVATLQQSGDVYATWKHTALARDSLARLFHCIDPVQYGKFWCSSVPDHADPVLPLPRVQAAIFYQDCFALRKQDFTERLFFDMVASNVDWEKWQAQALFWDMMETAANKDFANECAICLQGFVADYYTHLFQSVLLLHYPHVHGLKLASVLLDIVNEWEGIVAIAFNTWPGVVKLLRPICRRQMLSSDTIRQAVLYGSGGFSEILQASFVRQSAGTRQTCAEIVRLFHGDDASDRGAEDAFLQWAKDVLGTYARACSSTTLTIRQLAHACLYVWSVCKDVFLEAKDMPFRLTLAFTEIARANCANLLSGYLPGFWNACLSSAPTISTMDDIRLAAVIIHCVSVRDRCQFVDAVLMNTTRRLLEAPSRLTMEEAALSVLATTIDPLDLRPLARLVYSFQQDETFRVGCIFPAASYGNDLTCRVFKRNALPGALLFPGARFPATCKLSSVFGRFHALFLAKHPSSKQLHWCWAHSTVVVSIASRAVRYQAKCTLLQAAVLLALPLDDEAGLPVYRLASLLGLPTNVVCRTIASLLVSNSCVKTHLVSVFPFRAPGQRVVETDVVNARVRDFYHVPSTFAFAVPTIRPCTKTRYADIRADAIVDAALVRALKSAGHPIACRELLDILRAEIYATMQSPTIRHMIRRLDVLLAQKYVARCVYQGMDAYVYLP